MFYAVEVFAQKNPHGSVTSVSFVIHPSEARTMEAFQSASKQSSGNLRQDSVIIYKFDKNSVRLTLEKAYVVVKESIHPNPKSFCPTKKIKITLNIK